MLLEFFPLPQDIKVGLWNAHSNQTRPVRVYKCSLTVEIKWIIKAAEMAQNFSGIQNTADIEL